MTRNGRLGSVLESNIKFITSRTRDIPVVPWKIVHRINVVGPTLMCQTGRRSQGGCYIPAGESLEYVHDILLSQSV